MLLQASGLWQPSVLRPLANERVGFQYIAGLWLPTSILTLASEKARLAREPGHVPF
jgi:hypothetical protein